jgi:hypothetical protein
MKKILISLITLLVFPVFALAYFQPATLTNGVTKVAVYSQEQASRLFGQGFVLDDGKLGAFANPNVMVDTIFHKTIKNRIATKAIAPTVATATTTLTAINSGTTYLLSATGTSIILPAVTNTGVHYKFAINGAATGSNFIITSAEGDNIEGTLIVAGAVVDCDDVDVITFVTDGENLGDFVEVYSDGTNWLIGASGTLTASKMTCSG